jgi:hypothetical protein
MKVKILQLFNVYNDSGIELNVSGIRILIKVIILWNIGYLLTRKKLSF